MPSSVAATADAVLRSGHGVSDLQVAAVGQLGALEIRPQTLGRVQVGCVAGQSIHGQPAALALEVLAHEQAAMAGSGGSLRPSAGPGTSPGHWALGAWAPRC